MKLSALSACLVVTAVLAVHATETQEAGERECRAYAREAVAQFREANGFNRCRRRDARWHNNGQIHFDFCLRASSQQVSFESDARRTHLAKCKAGIVD